MYIVTMTSAPIRMLCNHVNDRHMRQCMEFMQLMQQVEGNTFVASPRNGSSISNQAVSHPAQHVTAAGATADCTYCSSSSRSGIGCIGGNSNNGANSGSCWAPLAGHGSELPEDGCEEHIVYRSNAKCGVDDGLQHQQQQKQADMRLHAPHTHIVPPHPQSLQVGAMNQQGLNTYSPPTAEAAVASSALLSTNTSPAKNYQPRAVQFTINAGRLHAFCSECNFHELVI